MNTEGVGIIDSGLGVDCEGGISAVDVSRPVESMSYEEKMILLCCSKVHSGELKIVGEKIVRADGSEL